MFTILIVISLLISHLSHISSSPSTNNSPSPTSAHPHNDNINLAHVALLPIHPTAPLLPNPPVVCGVLSTAKARSTSRLYLTSQHGLVLNPASPRDRTWLFGLAHCCRRLRFTKYKSSATSGCCIPHLVFDFMQGKRLSQPAQSTPIGGGSLKIPKTSSDKKHHDRALEDHNNNNLSTGQRHDKAYLKGNEGEEQRGVQGLEQEDN
ncbi:hypothetical protein F5Y18DRAFT_428321 [Xylariaceae sp. FL1019]|nr:hypothetical protein F5Y18DRAFT_428321 [Xylariaceae sp. FL1019]